MPLDTTVARHLCSERPRRLLYVLNHKTLTKAEVPILRELGYEVFTPKVVPEHDPAYRSAEVAADLDEGLTCSADALACLRTQDFYTRPWTHAVRTILNQEFDVIVVSWYLTPLIEALTQFSGLIVARVFGRESPCRYADFFPDQSRRLFTFAVEQLGERFVFGQGYGNIADIEEPELLARARTITVPLPDDAYLRQGSWSGAGSNLIVLCPSILEHGYYRDRYEEIKLGFGDLPHVIFGQQAAPQDDPAILPYLSDDALTELYASAPAFVYPSSEPRHVHYSPIEAMVIGTPVLYRRGALIDTLAGTDTPGACTDLDEMRAKAKALLSGDRRLAEAIRDAQESIIPNFSMDLARRQWADVLTPERW